LYLLGGGAGRLSPLREHEMPSPTSKGKSSLATKGKLVVIGVIALMVVIYATTFVMQVQACDQALSAIHAAYEKKLQFLRDSFNAYKHEHESMPAGGGRRRRKRDADLNAVVEELEADNEEVRRCLPCCVFVRMGC
jgi:hypothetical protein